MALPINVHEVIDLLGRLPRYHDVVLSSDRWRLRNPASKDLASGETAAGLRNALQEQIMPTTEEAMADFSMIYEFFPVTKFSAEVERAFARLRRCVESTREQPDAP